MPRSKFRHPELEDKCPSLPPPRACNALYYAEMQECLKSIMACPSLTGVACDAPLRLEEGASMNAFDADACSTALRLSGRYMCTGLFFWQDIMVSPSPGIRILQKYVHQVIEHHYSGPHIRIKHSITVLVPDEANYEPMNHFGSLLRISPDEWVHAPIQKLAASIGCGHPG